MSKSPDLKESDDKQTILDRVVPGYQESRLVMTACRLGVFEALGGESLNAGGLAGRLDLRGEGAEIFVNALAALGVLEKKGDLYSLAELSSRFLVPGGAEYRGDLYRHQEMMWGHWSRLEDILRGEPPGGSVIGCLFHRVFRSRDDRSRAAKEYIMAMDANASRRGPDVIRDIDLSGVGSILDLGGGPGTYTRLFLGKKSDLKITIFDRPGMVAISRGLEMNRGLEGSVSFREGDFLEDDLGGGYDLIWLSNAVHTMGPEDVRILLSRCRDALAGGGRILVHDFFLDESGTRPERAAVFSVHMLVVSRGGRSYRLTEMIHLLETAGFSDVSLAASLEDSGIVQGRKP